MVTRLQKLYINELQALKVDLENSYTTPEAENYAIQKILDDGDLTDCTSEEDLSIWMRSTGKKLKFDRNYASHLKLHTNKTPRHNPHNKPTPTP